jgi:hypothetical protein
MLSFWNKLAATSGVVTMVMAVFSLSVYAFSTEGISLLSISNSVGGSGDINMSLVINNGIVLPVTKNSPVIKKEDYSVKRLLKSVHLDSVDYTKSSSNRVMARSMTGFYYSENIDNNVIALSGFTPFKLENVGVTFRSDYRLIAQASGLNASDAAARLDILAISMIDDYGNAFEIRSKTGEFIGYAESTDRLTQGVINLSDTDSGFMFDYGEDVHVILSYNKDDVQLVAKINS